MAGTMLCIMYAYMNDWEAYMGIPGGLRRFFLLLPLAVSG